ncbi:archease [Desulfobacca acetoxidans]
MRSPKRSGFRSIAHTADVGFKLYGETLADIFVQGAHALYGMMVDRRRLRALESRMVAVDAPDREALLIAWLNHLLYLFDTTGFLGKQIDILDLSDVNLGARMQGEKLDPERHDLKTGVKAATYHKLAVRQTQTGWEATVIFDL